MHSSIFSSRWGRTWVLAAILTVGGVCGWECLLRARGHRPTVVDCPDLWAYWRSQAVGDRVVVVLGDSRPHLGWSGKTCERLMPGYRSIQLAMGGKHSVMASLKDLAEDGRFRGTVVIGMSELGFERARWKDQADLVGHWRRVYHGNAGLNVRISCWLHERIVALDPRLKLDTLIGRIAKQRAIPTPYYIVMDTARVYRADYTMPDWDRLAPMVGCWYTEAIKPARPEQWLEDAMALEPYVQAIQDRGGKVVFVRFPAGGTTLKIEEEAYPREQYWDRFAARTSAVCIHWRDHPELSRIPCPDGSHLDHRDSPAFTASLLRIWQERQSTTPEGCHRVSP